MLASLGNLTGLATLKVNGFLLAVEGDPCLATNLPLNLYSDDENANTVWTVKMLQYVADEINRIAVPGMQTVKCRVTRCQNTHEGFRHTQTGELYCKSCAAKINRANPEVPGLIRQIVEE